FLRLAGRVRQRPDLAFQTGHDPAITIWWSLVQVPGAWCKSFIFKYTRGCTFLTKKGLGAPFTAGTFPADRRPPTGCTPRSAQFTPHFQSVHRSRSHIVRRLCPLLCLRDVEIRTVEQCYCLPLGALADMAISFCHSDRGARTPSHDLGYD